VVDRPALRTAQEELPVLQRLVHLWSSDWRHKKSRGETAHDIGGAISLVGEDGVCSDQSVQVSHLQGKSDVDKGNSSTVDKEAAFS